MGCFVIVLHCCSNHFQEFQRSHFYDFNLLVVLCNRVKTTCVNCNCNNCCFFIQIGGLSIRCARVGGVEIPNAKRVQYSLQYIHGIGRTRALQILNDLKMENKITKDLSEEELIILRDEVSKYMIEGDLVIFSLLSHSILKRVYMHVFVLLIMLNKSVHVILFSH